MKRYFLALVALLFLSIACKKGETSEINPGVEPPVTSPTDPLPNPPAAGNIPAELVGKWSYGVFSPTNFWDYTGQYVGNAYEQALVFDFHADGTYKEYIINSTTAYNCRTEAYTYFEGRITVNATNHTFNITPISGNYRGFYSCAPKSNINRAAKASELIQEHMNYQVEGGKVAIKLSDAENPQGVRLKAITW